MNVYIRADASVETGTGHIMRCLVLGGLLRRSGARVAFISREARGHLCDYVEARGFEVLRLTEGGSPPVRGRQAQAADAAAAGAALASRERTPADWLVVDHYGLDREWEHAMRLHARRIMVIDDLADRPHDCDLLLDTSRRDGGADYDGLAPAGCRKLLGPKYALLRTEFWEQRACLEPRGGRLRRMLICFGGSDPRNQTAKALEAVRLLNRPDVPVDVVVGGSNPHLASIRRLCRDRPGIELHVQTERMAFLLARADLAIGAGGTSLWERCFLGLPSLTMMIAGNQLQVTQALEAEGAVLNLGWHEQVGPEQIQQAVAALMTDPGTLRGMEQAALRLMQDTRETAVVEQMMRVK